MVSYGRVFYVLGIIFLVFSGLMILPGIVDVCLINNIGYCFIISSLLCCFLGGILFLSNRIPNEIIHLNTKEKIILVLIAWIILPCLSILPFILSPFSVQIINALFEMAAAITTTGSSIIDLNSFSEGFSLWKAILQFAGGIFFIFTCLYIFSSFKLSYNTINIINVFDHHDSTTLKYIKNLTIVYLLLTLISSLIFASSGLSTLKSICYSFAAISTNGAVIANMSETHSVNFILSLLMFIGGCSCGLINRVLINGTSALNNRQFICYSVITICTIILLSFYMFFSSNFCHDIWDCFEKSALIITSSITTTGITTEIQKDFGNFIDVLLYIINFCGGCSGSCTGGIKIFRIMMIFILLKAYFIKLIKTYSVYVPTYDEKPIGAFEINTLFTYFTSYIILCVILSLILTFTGITFAKAINAIITTMNNNGPFFGLHKATSMQIISMSSLTKSVLIAAMIAGRVEFMLFFMIISKTFWKNA